VSASRDFGPDRTLETSDEDWHAEKLSEAGANVVDALAKLYELNDGDEAAVGEQMYEIDKAARAKANE
jgi:hypothetical protein